MLSKPYTVVIKLYKDTWATNYVIVLHLMGVPAAATTESLTNSMSLGKVSLCCR